MRPGGRFFVRRVWAGCLTFNWAEPSSIGGCKLQELQWVPAPAQAARSELPFAIWQMQGTVQTVSVDTWEASKVNIFRGSPQSLS